jgi:hypothetical protein
MILGSLDSKYDEDTQTSVGDGDDDRTTLAGTDEHGEQGYYSVDPASSGSISHVSTSRRVSTTGGAVAGSGAGFDRPRQAQTIQVGHMSRQHQPR